MGHRTGLPVDLEGSHRYCHPISYHAAPWMWWGCRFRAGHVAVWIQGWVLNPKLLMGWCMVGTCVLTCTLAAAVKVARCRSWQRSDRCGAWPDDAAVSASDMLSQAPPSLPFLAPSTGPRCSTSAAQSLSLGFQGFYKFRPLFKRLPALLGLALQ